MGKFIGAFFVFIEIQTVMIVEFYGVRKFKRWDLLMSGLNVILPWFVLCLLLRLMFCRCFVIDRIVVITWKNQV